MNLTPWVGAASAGIAILAAIAVLLAKKRARQRSEFDKEVVYEPKREPKTKDFSEEFGGIAGKFEFLFEDTYLHADRTSSSSERRDIDSVIIGWDQRIASNSDGPVRKKWNNLVKKYFGEAWYTQTKHNGSYDSSYRKKVALLKEWYEELEKAGVTRDDRHEIIANDFSAHHEYMLEEEYNIGDKIIIQRPCWRIGKKCVERGVAKVKN